MEEEHIQVSTQGFLGILRLDRPRALNALDHGMIQALQAGLAMLIDDPKVIHIAIVSTSSRAFCAGGDMRRIRQLVMEGEMTTALSFFRDEFALNKAIADCSKPIIALVDGICMGGGLGLSVHARYRVIAPSATLAMPETAIGYFPDVGATYFLNALPGNTGRWLGLTGARLTGREACAVGFGTHLAEGEKFDSILDALSLSPDTAGALKRESEEAGLPAVLDAGLDEAFRAPDQVSLDRALSSIAGGNDRAAAAVKALRSHSPAAIRIADQLLAYGRGKSLKDCLDSEYAALQQVFDHPDFVEGVRSVLVDKDHAPRWLGEGELQPSPG
jgi:enoyl-CoA hydratase